jgi:hypothetical protein
MSYRSSLSQLLPGRNTSAYWFCLFSVRLVLHLDTPLFQGSGDSPTVRTVLLLVFYSCRDKSCAVNGSSVRVCVWGGGQMKIISILSFRPNRISCCLGSQYLFNQLCTFSPIGILEARLSWPFAQDHLINRWVNTSVLVFWVVTLCGLVGRYHNFRGTYCFHLQGITTQKTSINIFTTVKTSNLIQLINSSKNTLPCYLNLFLFLIVSYHL